ncbi:MAG: carboxypeptidase-like regulatory domain-containing protein [Blastocatellia bacterium]
MPLSFFARWVGVCVFSLLLFPSLAADDLDHISIEGTLQDSAQQRIANAQITLIAVTTGQERTTTSDAQGHYRFMKLLPGEYELRVKVSGFRPLQATFKVTAGTVVRGDFRLVVAALNEQLTVAATNDQIIIDTTRTVVGSTITKRQIDDLPLESRNINDLIFMLSSAAQPAFDDRLLAEGDTKDRYRTTPEEAGIFALNGGTPFSNNLTIEGLDNNDDRGARERFTPSVDAVEEFQVISNQFSAEYGRAAGGRVNLRLRSGTNNYHGRAFYYFRDEALNANSFGRNADPARGFRLPYQNHNPGLTFGGPIVHKKAFFFAAYEYDNIYDRADIAALVPVASNALFPLSPPNGKNLGSTAFDSKGQASTVNGGAAVGIFDQQVTTPRTAHTVQTRTDFTLSNKQNLFAIFSLARQRDERTFPGGRRLLDTLRTTGRNSEAFAVAHNFTLSARAVNQARFQFARLTPADAPLNDNPVVIIDIDDPRDVSGNANANPFTRAGTLTAGSSNLSGVDRREDRYQVQDTLTYLRGVHNLHFGLDLQAIRSRYEDLSDVTGTFRFASPADFLAGKFTRYTHRFLAASQLANT